MSHQILSNYFSQYVSYSRHKISAQWEIFQTIKNLLYAQELELGLEIYSGEKKNKARAVLLACDTST